jgi:hypothetical protein
MKNTGVNSGYFRLLKTLRKGQRMEREAVGVRFLAEIAKRKGGRK